jgi:muramoyltetrapeptide carboxypeptidase
MEKGCKKPFFLGGRAFAVITPSWRKEYPTEVVEKSVSNFRKLGFRLLPGNNCKMPVSDNDFRRNAEQINKYFSDKQVGAMICRSGGGGALEVIKYLDINLLSENPKIICGYSDATSLLLHLNQRCNMVVFHGPSLISGFSKENKMTSESFKKMFLGKAEDYPVEFTSELFRDWSSGSVTGKVVGGNLRTLALYLDSYSIDFSKRILFIEEVNETLENVLFLLEFLRRKNVFSKVKGILVGRMKPLTKKELNTVKNFVLYSLGKRKIPVLYGFKSGHGKQKIVLPFGIDITVDSDSKKVVYEEYPFS